MEEVTYEREIGIAIVSISTRTATPCTGSPFGLARSVGTVGMMAAIAFKLSIDGATVNTEDLCNLLNGGALYFQCTQDIPVMRGELSIFYKVDSLLGGGEDTLISQFTSFLKWDVALSI